MTEPEPETEPRRLEFMTPIENLQRLALVHPRTDIEAPPDPRHSLVVKVICLFLTVDFDPGEGTHWWHASVSGFDRSTLRHRPIAELDPLAIEALGRMGTLALFGVGHAEEILIVRELAVHVFRPLTAAELRRLGKEGPR